MDRKLATIEKIKEIHPIPNADAIERAVIRGWNLVVKKGEFKPGDFCVYCEIDSLMPERPEFEFLRPRKFRIKTVKLRGQISQGIAFPLDIIKKRMIEPIGKNFDKIIGDHFIGLDVTEQLGVTKYEPPIPAQLSGQIKGAFPGHSIKTDEERIQNLIDVYDEYKKHKWIATEKLDGSSVTYFIYNDEFGVCSRNWELKETEKNTFWVVARSLNIEEKMREFMKQNNLQSLTLQGELLGEGIQSNKYRIKGQTVRFFRAFDPLKYNFYDFFELRNITDKMNLLTVPLIDEDFSLPDEYNDLILYADGQSKLAERKREGIVFVSKESVPEYQGRLSFKVISNKFILENND